MNTQELSKIMKALSNPNRLELYLEIAKNNKKSFKNKCDCFITEITKKFKIGAPTISHHLKELTNANLITTEKDGKFLIAKINKKIIQEAKNNLSL